MPSLCAVKPHKRQRNGNMTTVLDPVFPNQKMNRERMLISISKPSMDKRPFAVRKSIARHDHLRKLILHSVCGGANGPSFGQYIYGESNQLKKLLWHSKLMGKQRGNNSLDAFGWFKLCSLI
jgi:hypothetical protein